MLQRGSAKEADRLPREEAPSVPREPHSADLRRRYSPCNTDGSQRLCAIATNLESLAVELRAEIADNEAQRRLHHG